MADLNVMPLYTDAYLADTIHLNAAEHGAYLVLLIAMWRNGGSLPNDPERLRLIAKTYQGAPWKRTWAQIGQFFTIECDPVTGAEIITQKKLHREYERSTVKRAKNRANGHLGGSAKALKNNDVAVANASISLEQNDSETVANVVAKSKRKPDIPLATSHKPLEESKQAARAKLAPQWEACFNSIEQAYFDAGAPIGAPAGAWNHLLEWQRANHDPAICLVLIRERLKLRKAKGNKPPGSLKWFDDAIVEAHDKANPVLPIHKIPPWDRGEPYWRKVLENFRDSAGQSWDVELYGARPDSPIEDGDCHCQRHHAALLREFGWPVPRPKRPRYDPAVIAKIFAVPGEAAA